MNTCTTPTFSSAKRAFTLVELLVAMGVIAILVGITFGAVSGAWRSSNTAAASSQIQALATAVESYKVENGIYPQALDLSDTEEPSGNPTDYVTSGRLLFRAVTGIDPDGGTANWGDRPNKPSYFPNLKKNLIQQDSGGDYFVDPWGFAFGYRSLDYGETTDSSGNPTGLQGYNVGFFDLWSTGGSTEDDSPTWIVNWQDPNEDRLIAK